MRSPTAWSRFSAALSLLLHLVLVGAGPLVDAHLEVDALSWSDAPVHVEGGTGEPCHSGHAHQLCLIRALQSMDTPAGDVDPAPAPDLSPEERPHARLLAPRSPAVFTLGPRGPPAV